MHLKNDKIKPIMRIEKNQSNLSAAVNFLSYLRPSIGDTSLYTPEYFDWKIARNPFGDSASYLRFQDDRSAAHCSIVAKPANRSRLEGTVLGELGDTHTHPDFQKRGHFAAIGRHVIDDFAQSASKERALIYGLPNENALPGWTRSIGCRQLDHLQIIEMQLVPWRCLRRWPWRGARSSCVELHPLADASAVIEEIWPKVQNQGWLIQKDARWWKWRYSENNNFYHTFVVRASAGTAIIGWVAMRKFSTKVPGLARYAICDIVTIREEDEPIALEAILRTAGPMCVISGWFDSAHPLSRKAIAMGFQHTRNVPVIFADNEAFWQLTNDKRPCRISMGDTDNA